MKKINELVNYGLSKNLISKRDVTYIINQIIYLLNIEKGFTFEEVVPRDDIDSILEDVASLKTDLNSIQKEHFKSKIMATMIDRPSLIEAKFYEKFSKSPKEATNFFYKFSEDVNYIKSKAISKNIKFPIKSIYAEMFVTINMSKPEKTPEEIKMMKNIKSIDWPKCLLCVEYEGYFGNPKSPDRANHRIINVTLGKDNWFFQYSPYSYFNEHSILLKEKHSPMKINKNTFENLTSFLEQFPHYTIGSNADLPIVGGSVLSHDHYQAGNFEFPIFKCNDIYTTFDGDVKVSIINWPLSTVKIVAEDKDDIVNKSYEILNLWKSYSNESLNIYNETDSMHNTITPIFRKFDGKFEAYLMLRNNITTNTRPEGLFHAHPSKHYIKRENIGLIEAAGLAVLPARLQKSLDLLKSSIENNTALPHDISQFKPIFDTVKLQNNINVEDAIKNEVGKIFVSILEDCSVFKSDIEAFENFLKGN